MPRARTSARDAVLSSKEEVGEKEIIQIDISELTDAVSSLVLWADGSLESLRPGLVRTSYVLTLHACMSLVLDGAFQEAHALMCAHRAFFERALLRESVSSVLSALSLLTDPHLNSSCGLRPTRAERLRFLLSPAPQFLPDAVEPLPAPSGSCASALQGKLFTLLADPLTRSAVSLCPLARDLLLARLRSASCGHTLLLSLLNDRVQLSAAKSNDAVGDDDGSHAPFGSRMLEADKLTAAEGFVQWGVPWASHAFVGALAQCDVPFPNEVTTSSSFVRALLSSASEEKNGAQSNEVVPTSQSVPTAPALRTTLVFSAGDALRCMAAVVPLCGNNTRGHLVSRVVASGYGDGSVRVWVTLTVSLLFSDSSAVLSDAPAVKSDISTRPTLSVLLQSRESSAVRCGPVTALAVSRCGTVLVSCHADGNCALWHLEGLLGGGVLEPLAKDLRAQAIKDAAPGTSANVVGGVGSSSGNSSIHLLMDPLFVSSCGSAVSSSVGLAQCPVWTAAFNPLSPGVWATGGRDGCAYVWSSAFVSPLRVCAGHGSDVTALAWHPNGAYLLTGSGDGTVRLWDPSAGRCVHVFFGTIGRRISCLAVSPGGRFLVAGDERGSVALWELGTAALVATLQGHHKQCALSALAFSSGGRLLVSVAPAEPLANCDSETTSFSLFPSACNSMPLSSTAVSTAQVCTWDIARAVVDWEARLCVNAVGGGHKAADHCGGLVSSSSFDVPVRGRFRAPEPYLVSVLRIPGVCAFALAGPLVTLEEATEELLLVGTTL